MPPPRPSLTIFHLPNHLCGRPRAVVVDLVRPGQPVGPTRKKRAHLSASRYDRAGLSPAFEECVFSTLNHEDSACAGGPSPPASSSLMHALSLCRPAGLNVDGGRGLRARYLGADGDGGHLGDLRRAKRTSFLLLLGRGGRWEEREAVASVRPEIAAEAALARVGRLWRYSVLCGWPGEVVGRLARLGMYMRSLKT